MLALVVGMQQPLLAAKLVKEKNRAHSSSSSDCRKTKKCCKKVLEELDDIARFVQQDYVLDTNTNLIVQEINQTTKDDLAIDEQILALDTEIKSITQEILDETGSAIYQADIDAGDGTLTLTESGKYCIAENLVGTIAVGTNCICIDLCCHTVDADGAPSAFVATGMEGLKIYNGCITGSTTAAISIANYTGVELHDLLIHDYTMDGIFVDPSNDVSVHDINFVSNNTGERALHFNQVNNFAVSRCNASGFLSTIGSILELNSCTNGIVQDVNVTNNTKTVAVSNSSNQQKSFASVNTSNSIDFLRVKVNMNTNTTQVANGYTALGFFNSPNCTIRNCETNNNTNTATSLVSFDQILATLNCDNIRIIDSEVNYNSSTAAINRMAGCYVFNSFGAQLDGVQANFNSVSEFSINPTRSNALNAIYVTGPSIIGSTSKDLSMRNCQAHRNSVASSGAPVRTATNFAYIAGIHVDSQDSALDNCHASNNTMGDNNPFTDVEGIELGGNTPGGVLSNSSASFNTGGEEAYGITFNFATVPGLITGGRALINCEASYNGNYGLNINFPNSAAANGALDFVIRDSIFIGNGGNFGPAAGIYLRQLGLGIKNVLIKGCQIFDTNSTATTNGDATGIFVAKGNNVVIEDTEVYTTNSSTGAGHGILFNTVQDSKVINTELHGNKNNGVKFVGTNNNNAIIESIAIDNGANGFELSTATTNSLVKNSLALSNAGTGFVDATAFQNAWLGNQAQNNTVAGYSGIAAGNISTYSKATGAYAGGSAPNIYCTTNLLITP